MKFIKYWAAITLSIPLGLFPARAEEPYQVPTSQEFGSANPFSASGGSWTLYQLMDDATPTPEKTYANFTAMNYSGSRWVGADLDPQAQSHPHYEGAALTSAGKSAGKDYASAISFKPVMSGKYSWTGDLFCTDASSPHHPTRLTFGKLSHSSWIGYKDVFVSYNNYLHLDQVPELQEIPLKSDEKLVLIVRSSHASANAAVFKYGSSSVALKKSGPVNAVPDFVNPWGNPSNDSPTGEWKIQYITETSKGFETNYENYHPMVWNDPVWNGVSLKWGHPRFLGASRILTSCGVEDSGSGVPGERKSALTFEPLQSGIYKVSGILKCIDWSLNEDTQVTFGIFPKDKGHRKWSQIYPASVPDDGEVNLGSVGSLASVPMNAGDTFTIIVSSPSGSAGAAYFAETPANPVSIDRLPHVYPVLGGAPAALLMGPAYPRGLNPGYDFARNKWELRQITSGDYANVGSYSTMTWNSTSSRWQGTTMTSDDHPAWYQDSGTMSSGRKDVFENGVPVITFTPSIPGQFSWAGRLDIEYWNPAAPVDGSVVFGKVKANEQYQLLHTHPFSLTEGLHPDLELISALQGITVDEGEYLTASLHSGLNTANGASFAHVSIKAGNHGDRWNAQSANPMVDQAGNSWQMWQISSGDQTNWGAYVPMIWNGGAKKWNGPSMTGDGHPSWYPLHPTF